MPSADAPLLAALWGADLGTHHRGVAPKEVPVREPLWKPSWQQIEQANLTAFMRAVEKECGLKFGSFAEPAVSNVIHNRPVKNVDALANPQALELFRDLPELRS